MTKSPRRSFLDVQFEKEARTALPLLGVAAILAGVFIVAEVAWDRWFPEVGTEEVPPEIWVDRLATTQDTIGDSGPIFGTWTLLGLALAIAGLWLVLHDARRSTASRKKSRQNRPTP